jgi:hypothetical protein
LKTCAYEEFNAEIRYIVTMSKIQKLLSHITRFSI